MKHIKAVLVLFILGIVAFLCHRTFWPVSLQSVSRQALVMQLLSVVAILPVLWCPVRSRITDSVVLGLPFGVYLTGTVVARGEEIPFLSSAHFYAFGIDLALLAVTVWLAWRFSFALKELEDAVEIVSLPNRQSQVRSIQEAINEVNREVSRCRRKNQPLSLILVKPDFAALNAPKSKLVEEMQQALSDRYASSRLGLMISNMLRSTDLIVEEKEKGYFVILCPETAEDRIKLITNRIQELAFAELSMPITFGAASLPEESYSLEGLIDKASSRFEFVTEHGASV